jgi:cytochrome bd ubiquinol oxidase subunit II
MAEALLAVMLVALSLYTVLAGADFGAGMMEGLMGRKARERVDVALAPVWEANHVWLVLMVVIAFVGFPRLYTLLSTYLHIPILFALLGIVARGSAFTFRHYDPSATFDRWYTAAFRFASALAPLSMGLVLAATASGSLPVGEQGDFYSLFIAPWNTLFGWATGVFVCALFAFEGAALLAAEHPRSDAPLPYLRAARNAQGFAIASGALVLLIAYLQELPWFADLLGSPLAIAAVATATCLIAVVAYAFHTGRPWLLRFALGAQACCVLFGFFSAQFPVLLRTRAGGLSYQQLAAPPSTLRGLLWAVGIGFLLIAPSLTYLILVYKRDSSAARARSEA